MDNTLKCRVWDKTTKTMHYNDFVITSTGYIAKLERVNLAEAYNKSPELWSSEHDSLFINQKFVEFEKDKIALKCTGLEDKNGTLIYEGDILKETYTFEGEQEEDITVVEWLEGSAGFAMLHIDYIDFTYFDEKDVDLSRFEIIGNKYENPELIGG